MEKEVLSMEIGNVIRGYRLLKNMTQEELGAALIVTPQAVSRWETGVSYPDIAMIPEIVKVLGVSADTLLGCDNPASDKDGEQPPVLDYSTLVASVQDIKGLNSSREAFPYLVISHSSTALKRSPSVSM